MMFVISIATTRQEKIQCIAFNLEKTRILVIQLTFRLALNHVRHEIYSSLSKWPLVEWQRLRKILKITKDTHVIYTWLNFFHRNFALSVVPTIATIKKIEKCVTFPTLGEWDLTLRINNSWCVIFYLLTVISSISNHISPVWVFLQNWCETINNS